MLTSRVLLLLLLLLQEKLAGSDSGHIFVTTSAGSLTPGEKPAGW
jgi:hypothetical protein